MKTDSRSNPNLTVFVYNFNFEAIESLMGLDMFSALSLPDELYDLLGDHGLYGITDLSMIMYDALQYVIDHPNAWRDKLYQFTTVDYVRELSDIVDNLDEDGYLDLDYDVVCDVANLCFKIHNVFVIGLTMHLSKDEREYLTKVMVHDGEMPQGSHPENAVVLTDDAILITCNLSEGKDAYDDSQALKDLHDVFLARAHRRLSSATQ